MPTATPICGPNMNVYSVKIYLRTTTTCQQKHCTILNFEQILYFDIDILKEKSNRNFVNEVNNLKNNLYCFMFSLL